jgi:hypothetical protein
MQTWHAVVAFQGWSGMARDSIAGPLTLGALARARTPTPWSRATGFEIHVSQQVLLLVRDGRVQRSIHVPTGAGGRTPLGHFHVYRRELVSWSVPFHAWIPLAQYFSGATRCTSSPVCRRTRHRMDAFGYLMSKRGPCGSSALSACAFGRARERVQQRAARTE